MVSLTSGAVAAWVLAQIARPLLGERGAHDVVLYFALYPVGFVFTSLYSDGLFLALAAGSFLAATRGRPIVAGVLGGLAVGTRLIGLALLPALAVPALARPRPTLAGAARAAPAAAGRGRPVRALPRRDASATRGRSRAPRPTGIARPRCSGRWTGLKDAVLAAGRGARDLLDLPAAGPGHDQRVGLWNLSHLALLVAAAWLTWVAWRRLGAAFGAYSAATLVIALSAPAEGFPLVSLPRFLLADFPLFLALASLTLDRPRARDAVIAAFAALGAVAAVAFARGVWIA